MSYLTLDEAASYVINKSGQIVEPANLLRAGVQGVLLLCAPFGFRAMYNATIGQEEDFRAGLLVIPPSHLLEIETEGSATIQAAHSLDGKTLYFPVQSRTRDQLRVLVTELDRFIPSLQEKQPQAEAVENNGTGSIKKDEKKSQLHILIWRVYLFLDKDRKRKTAQAVWNEIQFRHNDHDTDNIIQEVVDNKISWCSGYGNEQTFSRRTLDKTLSNLKKTPPL